MSVTSAVQAGLKALIDSGSTGLEFYDAPPANSVKDYITYDGCSEEPDDADCVRGHVVISTLSVWASDQGALQPCQAYVNQIIGLVHEVSMTLDSPYHAVNTRVTYSDVFRDADGITAHGVLRIQTLAETR